jgi:D-alanyl-D-alanine dipeptidase
VRPSIFIALFFIASCASVSTDDPLHDSRQLIVVTSPSWDAIDGEMRRFERDSPNAAWRAAGEPIPVVLGRTGLAWGSGTIALPSTPPQKREGDGKSPAGIFTLGYAFGFDDSADTKMPYKKLRDTTECVDDVKSPYYNEVVDRDPSGPATWTSSEKMRTVEQYQRGALVNHNVPPKAGAGSCIFLHIWSGASHPTAGCTAMRREDLDTLLRWIDPPARTLIVQLPAGEYSSHIHNWRLPDISLTQH